MDVTCLIPAFKVKYASELLYGLNRQRFQPSRIVISDDSPDNDFINFLETVPSEITKHLPLEIYIGPKQGHYKNIEFLLSKYKENPTTHFHILNDDDLILPDFYYEHARGHQDKDITCSVSRRWFMTPRGLPRQSLPLPDKLANLNQIRTQVLPDAIARTYIAKNNNWLGELSCAVFSGTFLDSDEGFHTFQGVSIAGLNDIASFLRAALIGKLLFINQHLGMFRLSPEGHTKSCGFVFSLAILAKINFAIIAYQNKLVDIRYLRHAINVTQSTWHQTYGDNRVTERLSTFTHLVEDGDIDTLKSEYLAFHRMYSEALPQLHRATTKQLLLEELHTVSA